MRPRCPLAVCAVTPAVRASSDAVGARPSIRSCSMAARAGSPIRAATSERALTVIMIENLGLRPAPCQGQWFGRHRKIIAGSAPLRQRNHLSLQAKNLHWSGPLPANALALRRARQAVERFFVGDLLCPAIIAVERAEL